MYMASLQGATSRSARNGGRVPAPEWRLDREIAPQMSKLLRKGRMRRDQSQYRDERDSAPSFRRPKGE